MEIKKRIRKNIFCLIVLGICFIMCLMGILYCINELFIIGDRTIKTLVEFFLFILSIIILTIGVFYFMLELISVLNTEFYEGILLAIRYYPEYDSEGGDPIDALIYEIKLIDSGKIVKIEETYIEDENRKKDVCADGTDIVGMYSYKEFKKTSYDVRDYDGLIQLSYKYMGGKEL